MIHDIEVWPWPVGLVETLVAAAMILEMILI